MPPSPPAAGGLCVALPRHLRFTYYCLFAIVLLGLGHHLLVGKATKKGGRTALHLASLKDHVEVVQFLLAQGADPEATDDENRTPLFLACDALSTVRTTSPGACAALTCPALPGSVRSCPALSCPALPGSVTSCPALSFLGAPFVCVRSLVALLRHCHHRHPPSPSPRLFVCVTACVLPVYFPTVCFSLAASRCCLRMC